MNISVLKACLTAIACCFLLCSQTQTVSAYTWSDGQISIDDCSVYDTYAGSCGCGCDCGCVCTDSCECSPFWVDAEYLYWQVKDSPRIVPLVFTGLFDATAPQPTLMTSGTKIVLGDHSIKDNGRSGAKFSAGYNFCCEQLYAADANYFFLDKHRHSSSVQSNDFLESKVTTDTLITNSYLAVPYFNESTAAADSVYIAVPAPFGTPPLQFSGKAILKTKNWMQGAEFNLSTMLNVCSNFQFRALAGFRYFNFNDKLEFTTMSPSKTNVDVFTTFDQFKTTNTFYGGQIGFDGNYTCGRFSCNAKAKVALGAMDEQLKINGSLFTNDFDNFGAVQQFSGGYFAQTSNIGNYEKTHFAYIPEVNLNFGYQFNDCWHFNLGYSFLYVSRVLWAENQIDPRINPTQSPAIERNANATLTGIAAPTAKLRSRDLWVQGLNVGFNYSF